MNRDEQEMALWRRVFERWYARDTCYVDTSGNIADAAVAEFRKRYPAEPTAPPAVWYDEPPFAKDGATRPCWIAGGGNLFSAAVYWNGHEWLVYVAGVFYVQRLAGRRVCPIVKPQEPKQ